MSRQPLARSTNPFASGWAGPHSFTAVPRVPRDALELTGEDLATLTPFTDAALLVPPQQPGDGAVLKTCVATGPAARTTGAAAPPDHATVIPWSQSRRSAITVAGMAGNSRNSSRISGSTRVDDRARPFTPIRQRALRSQRVADRVPGHAQTPGDRLDAHLLRPMQPRPDGSGNTDRGVTHPAAVCLIIVANVDQSHRSNRLSPHSPGWHERARNRNAPSKGSLLRSRRHSVCAPEPFDL